MACTLTERQREVLAMVSEGMTSKEVARELCVSKRTIDFHLDKIYGALGVSNRVQALRRVYELGLL